MKFFLLRLTLSLVFFFCGGNVYAESSTSSEEAQNPTPTAEKKAENMCLPEKPADAPNCEDIKIDKNAKETQRYCYHQIKKETLCWRRKLINATSLLKKITSEVEKDTGIKK